MKTSLALFIICLNRLARVSLVEMAERTVDVIEYHKQRLGVAKEAGDRKGEAQAYCALGNAYRRLGNVQEAIEHHKKHLSIAQEVGDRIGEGVAYNNLGNACSQRGNFQEAINYHNRHLGVVQETGDRTGEGGVYCNLAISYCKIGDFQKGIECHKKYLSIAKEVGDNSAEGYAHGNLGAAYSALGDFQQAIEHHNKQLRIAKEINHMAMEGRAYSNLGIAYESLGNFQEAIKYYNKQLSIVKEMNDKAGEGPACCNLGNAYHNLGNVQQALEYYNKHLIIAKEVGDRAGEGVAYGNLGIFYLSSSNYQEALEYTNKQLSIALEFGDRNGEGRAYSNLGHAYEHLGYIREAIEYFNKHLKISKEMADEIGEGVAYSNLANAYGELGNVQFPLEYHTKHLNVAKKVGDRAGEGRANGNLGNAYEHLGKFEEAIEHHEESQSIAKEVGDRDGEGRAYGNLGNVYHRLGNFHLALEYHNRHLSVAKEVSDRAAEGNAYGNIGNAYLGLGDFQKAIEFHKKQLGIAKEVGDRIREGTSCYFLGCDFQAMGSLQEALDYYKTGVQHLNFTRALLQSKDAWKISFRELHRDTYTALWKSLLSLDKTVEALCAAEQGRAQALSDGLKIQYGCTIPPSASLESKETTYYISNELAIRTVFIALQGNTINFWLLGKGNKVAFRRTKIESRTADKDAVTDLLETVLKNIDAGVGVRCENCSLGELSYDSQSAKDSNEELVESSHCTIRSLQPLYDAIVGPIVDLLQDDELIIVPDGPLCLAPLCGLSESIRIRTVPSLTSLKLITDCPEDYHCKSGALLVGDPCLKHVTKKGKPKYDALPGAKKEVEMIREIIKVPPLTGTEASKQEVLEGITSVALVHIAAHGRKETGEIALAPNPGRTSKIPKEEDYMLKISDVQAVQLKARLVVLSCCHSGRGEVKSEGVVGIARAFLAAGARSVLVTLWAISDEATMEFMSSFYQHLRNGQRASVALHQAMKSLRDSERFCAAKYWAPFLLIGDDVTLEFADKELGRCK